MVADAWYMVSEYKLNLGPSDTLENLIHYIYGLGELKSSEKKEAVLEYLEASKDRNVREKRNTLTYNVPYRLQAPFLTGIKGKEWDQKPKVVSVINQNRFVMYKILYDERIRGGGEKKVQVVPEWQEYIEKNYSIIKGWIQYHLIMYLQRRNPSVPGIASKLYAPAARNLARVQKYWKAVIDVTDVVNIYNGQRLQKNDISIDHFIPWSYVVHDELWNLVPTSKSVNSSKGNALPDWEKYFSELCKVEYEALCTAKKHVKIEKLLKNCKEAHINNDEIRHKMYETEVELETFGNMLTEVMEPVYKSAKNMGFGQWM